MADQIASGTRLYEIVKSLSADQLRFVAARVATNTDEEAANAINVAPTTVYCWPEKKLINEAVELAHENAVVVVIRQMELMCNEAFGTVVDVMLGASSDATRLKAACELLDRAGLTKSVAAKIKGQKPDEQKLTPDQRRKLLESLAEVVPAMEFETTVTSLEQ